MRGSDDLAYRTGRTKPLCMAALSAETECGHDWRRSPLPLVVEVDLRTGVAYTREWMAPLLVSELSPWRGQNGR